MNFFVSCPKSMESLLFDELTSLGISECKQTVAGVYIDATLQQAYSVIMWSRLANQLLLQLGEFPASNQDELYQAASHIAWDEVFTEQSSFSVKFSGTNLQLKHTKFSALKIKDAIVDCFRAKTGTRPNVEAKNPDIAIHGRLHRDKVTLSVDIAGGSLHRRKYRDKAGRAPLKENLAAAILLRCGWSIDAKLPLLDPMCGTGTLVIEAALMQADIAPGLVRQQTLNAWRGHRPALWNEQLSIARERRAEGLKKCESLPRLTGFDEHYMSIQKAQHAAQIAGITDRVHFQVQSLEQLQCPKKQHQGILLSNLPYGERLGNTVDLLLLYRQFAKILPDFEGWSLNILVADSSMAGNLPYRWDKNYNFYNGQLEVQLLCFELNESQRRQHHLKSAASTGDFANRLRKNLKKLKPWIKKLPSNCYRIYDADIPEYSVAVDIYADQVQVSEYVAPKTVDEAVAQKRLQEVLAACLTVLELDPDKLHLKQRARQKGTQQYEKQQQTDDKFQVFEGRATFWVNLKDYLDTGLFLDHRPVRFLIAEKAKAKRFLNLFCYTGTASVHAALAGAITCNVDLSNTYLNWAKDNLRLNHATLDKHEFIRADISQWLLKANEEQRKFDVILLDPPSFSNSKSMEASFDVQRDHVQLIEHTMSLLAEGGELIFSNNRRGFKLDEQILENFEVENIHQQTIDKDFERNSKIHCCYLIKNKT